MFPIRIAPPAIKWESIMEFQKHDEGILPVPLYLYKLYRVFLLLIPICYEGSLTQHDPFFECLLCLRYTGPVGGLLALASTFLRRVFTEVVLLETTTTVPESSKKFSPNLEYRVSVVTTLLAWAASRIRSRLNLEILLVKELQFF